MHNDGNVALRAKGLCAVVPHYEHMPLTLNGIRLTDFCIVYPNDAKNFEKTVAEALSARIADLCGDVLELFSDSPQISKPKI